MAFICKSCEMSFQTISARTHHEKIHANPLYAFNCDSCAIPFTRRDNLTRHNKKYHQSLLPSQSIKRKIESPQPTTKKSRDYVTKRAINDLCKTYSWELTDKIDPSIVLKEYENKILDLISPQNKWYLLMEVEFSRENETVVSGFRNKTKISINDDLSGQYKEAAQEIISNIEAYESKGSGWIIKKLNKIELHMVKYKPFAASSYVDLPHKLKNSKYELINPENSDDKCFMWCVLALIFPAHKDPQRIYNYDEHVNKLISSFHKSNFYL